MTASPQDALSVDGIRNVLSGWLTMALDIRSDGPTTGDLLALRDWIDGGCAGEPPWPSPNAHSATAGAGQGCAQGRSGTSGPPADLKPLASAFHTKPAWVSAEDDR